MSCAAYRTGSVLRCRPVVPAASAPWVLGAVVAGALAVGSSARAGQLRPFAASTHQLLAEAEEARKQGLWDQARDVLDQVERQEARPLAKVELIRGRLARDQGALDTAAEHWRRAATIDPAGDARVELAALLVDRGRWPEAVVELRRAFQERGSSLPVEDVIADARFVMLKEFKPYRELTQEMKSDQNSWLGKLRLRLERLEATSRAVEEIIVQVQSGYSTAANVVRHPWSGVVGMIMLSFFFGLGIAQMRLIPPPWTLVIGWGAAAFIWNEVAGVVGKGEAAGGGAITVSGLLILTPVGLGLAVRAWRYLNGYRAQKARQPAPPPPVEMGRAAADKRPMVSSASPHTPVTGTAKVGGTRPPPRQRVLRR